MTNIKSKPMKYFILFTLTFLSLFTFAQETQLPELITPAKGKSMVYFTRTSSVGMLINFSFYDGEELIGKLKPGKFIAYECTPGNHVFIGKSENTDYVEANLEEGKIYVIDSEAQMGAFKARVKLVPLDKTNEKKYKKGKKNFLKLIAKNKGEVVSFEEEQPTEEVDNEKENNSSMSKTLAKFYENKQKNKKITQLTPEMYVDMENLLQE